MDSSNDLYYHFFNNTDRNIIELKYVYLKQLFLQTTTANIIHHMIQTIEQSLQMYNQIVVYMDLSTITLLDIDKYKYFIRESAIILKHKFPDILDICYVQNAPFIFSQLIKVFGLFIDKKTQKKIVLIDDEIARKL